MRAAVGGPDGFFAPLTRALGVAARDLSDENEVIAFARALVIARADPVRVAHYSEDWMRATLRRFKAADPPRRSGADHCSPNLLRPAKQEAP